MKTAPIFKPRFVSEVPEITAEELKPHLTEVTLVDVRQADEFNGELSHIPGAKLVTLGPDLELFLKAQDHDDEIVFICRSGGRSGKAALLSRSLGFTKTVSLQGGMLGWNQKKYLTKETK